MLITDTELANDVLQTYEELNANRKITIRLDSGEEWVRAMGLDFDPQQNALYVTVCINGAEYKVFLDKKVILPYGVYEHILQCYNNREMVPDPNKFTDPRYMARIYENR